MVSVELRFFGPPRAFNYELGVETSFPRRTGALLAYLALFHERPHSRGRLAGLFWGGQREESARRCLSTTLWRIRERLSSVLPDPREILVGDRFQVTFRLVPWVRLDVHAFEEAISPIAHRSPLSSLGEVLEVERGLALYRAEFLDGYFDDWVLRERERLRRLKLNSLAALVRFHRERGEVNRAIDRAQELLREDPFQEAVLRELMRLHVQAGQRALALEQYRMTARALAEDLEAEPMEETRALYDQIREGRHTPTYRAIPDPWVEQVIRTLRGAAQHLEAARSRADRRAEPTEGDDEPESA